MISKKTWKIEKSEFIGGYIYANRNTKINNSRYTKGRWNTL